MAEIVAPRPASTILLLRDSAVRGADGKGRDVDGKGCDEIEVFMMVRHYEIDFNSGALVFPGGSVDKNDKEIIASPELYSGGEGCDADALSFRIARQDECRLREIHLLGDQLHLRVADTASVRKYR